jgi:hypothetical protein
MEKNNILNNNYEKVHWQFKNELFLRYLKYFTKLNIIYTNNKLEDQFFDKNTQTLKIPQNISLEQMKKVINFLDKLVKYNLWITAKKRLRLEESKILRSKISVKNNFENSLLRESLYESWKKYILDTLEEPNSNFLLKEKIRLEEISKNFQNLDLHKQQKFFSDVLQILWEYNTVSSEVVDWWLPMIFLKNKKMYCVWYSYLLDIIAEKLNVKHYTWTWFMKNDNWKKTPHSFSIIELKNKFYILDPSLSPFLEEVKLKKWRVIFWKNTLYSWGNFTYGPSEKEIIAQNFYNIALDEKNISNKKKLLDYAKKLSPNNVVIKQALQKLK